MIKVNVITNIQIIIVSNKNSGSWFTQNGLKKYQDKQQITTTRCITPQKSAVLTYLAVEA